MKIKINPNNLTIMAENKTEIQKLDELYEKFVVYRRVYNPISKKREMQKIYLLHKPTSGMVISPIGLIYDLNRRFFEDNPIKYSLHKPYFNDLKHIEKLTFLRDYQKEAVRKAVENGIGIIKAPPGAGKTIVMVGICKMIKDDIPILIIVPKTKNLLIQTVNVFKRFFSEEEIGFSYGEGIKTGRIMICSPQGARKISYKTIPILLYDEVHSVGAKTSRQIVAGNKKAVVRIGLSATPFGRSDEKDYITKSLFGNIIYEITYDELKEKGFSADIEYKVLKFSSIALGKPELLEYLYSTKWNEVINKFIIENEARTKIILQLVKKTLECNRNLLIITERIEHGRKLESHIREICSDIAFIYSGSKNNYKAIEDFRKGKIKVLIGTQLVELGIDIPNLQTIILASIGKSSIQLIQRIGRGLRPKENDKLIVYDLVDKDNIVLIRHYYQRKKVILKHNFKIIEKEIK